MQGKFGKVAALRVRWLGIIIWALTVLGAPALSAAERRPTDSPEVAVESAVVPPLPRDFDTVSRGWLHISHPASMSHWVEPLLEEGDAFKRVVGRKLGQDILHDVRVRLATNPGEMARLAPSGAPYPKYAVGVAYSRLGLILLSRDGVHPNSSHELREVFRHELAHVALHHATGGRHVPLWFNEGLAVVLSGENQFERTRALWTATLARSLLPLKELNRNFPNDVVGVPLAYAQSADVVRFLARQDHSIRFGQLVGRLRKGQDFDRALMGSFGMDSYNLETAWREEVENRYSFWPLVLSGSLVWVLAVGLAVVAWRRKLKRQRLVLARWAREEAAEDARRRAAELAFRAPWIAIKNISDRRATQNQGAPPPKIEHDGSWHTLH